VAGGGLLAACGSDPETDVDAPTQVTRTPTDEPDGGSAGGTDGSGGGSDAEVLVATGDVPDGGGVILADVVVAQPTSGEFTAFSARCTHEGCKVDEVAGGTINCPCHNSQFSIADGSVVAGPAPSPLPAVPVKVDGDSVVRA
jgi:Rieske Fe-S protein